MCVCGAGGGVGVVLTSEHTAITKEADWDFQTKNTALRVNQEAYKG